MFRSKLLCQFDKGNVSPGFNRSQQEGRPRFNPVRTAIATLFKRMVTTAGLSLSDPADNAR